MLNHIYTLKKNLTDPFLRLLNEYDLYARSESKKIKIIHKTLLVKILFVKSILLNTPDKLLSLDAPNIVITHQTIKINMLTIKIFLIGFS